MTEPNTTTPAQRAARQQLQERAAEASRHLGAILAIPGVLDPQERVEIVAAQALVRRFLP